MADPLPYEPDQIGQLPESGDPRLDLNYFLRVIKGVFEDGGGGSAYAFASASTGQSITEDALTDITFNTNDETPVGVTHDTVTDNEEFTVLAAGIYSIGCSAYASPGTVGANGLLQLKVNGDTVLQDVSIIDAIAGTSFNVARDMKLAVNDVVVAAFQLSDEPAPFTLSSQKFWITKY